MYVCFSCAQMLAVVVHFFSGYMFSWAVIFTFWYHPMEPTMGHLFGFMHTWMVMLQGSLMFTTAHLNYYWRLACESWVFIHATVIAMQVGRMRARSLIIIADHQLAETK